MMDYAHSGSWMIDNHSKDRSVKEVLMMVLVMHIEEDDMVLHIEMTDMLMLVVEIDVGGMTADVVDKLNCSSDDVQPRQVDLRFAHALTKFHWHDTHVNLDRHEVDQCNSHGVILPSCMQTYQTHSTVCTPSLALSKTCLASAFESFPKTLSNFVSANQCINLWEKSLKNDVCSLDVTVCLNGFCW
nr:hypothetical protein [Tanacetum cinerariifolium]